VLMATQSAIQPRLIGIRLLPAAAALGGISTGITVTVGPALAGVLIASVGFQWCYTVDAVLFVAALAGVLTLPSLPPEGVVDRPGLASLASGLRFLRSAPNVRMSFFVDIVAMTFGQSRVLLPAAAALLLGGGAVTVGILSAAMAVGVLISSVFSGRLGAVRWQGVAIERSIQVYGACIVGFGVVLLLAGPGPHRGLDVPAIVAAGALLAGAGASDNVSSIFRSTLLQAAAPDSVRGRLQGVFVVVVTGGPRVGDLYVGLLASTTLLWLPPAAGGLIVIALVALLARRSGFRAYDALHPKP
jgi:hypothetical protein